VRDPLLKRALAYWLASCEVRKPACIGCKAQFMDGSAEPCAYLFVVSPNIPGAASTSAFCDRCWRGDQALPVCQIETIVTRLLRRFLPGGSLEPLP
jgi:hypothetical protein